MAEFGDNRMKCLHQNLCFRYTRHHYTLHKIRVRKYNLIPPKNSKKHLFFHPNEIDSDLGCNRLPDCHKNPLNFHCCHKFRLLDYRCDWKLKFLHQLHTKIDK